uniref:Cathepsin L n=1 Tax=Riptortus pedestris TaxID=329032 RepID=R4WMN8_RIPPE|nr:cathepsin L [Riptortus pedestris]
MEIVYFLTLLGVALSTTLDEWTNFKLAHGKSYGDQSQEKRRMEIYQRNKQFIDEHNQRYALGLETYTLAMNKFGDLTEEEFAEQQLGAAVYLDRHHLNTSGSTHIAGGGNLPASMDWRSMGAVTAVRDQGDCGSCYAISTATTVETQVYLRTGELTPLSPQQIVECSNTYRYKNMACKGGWLDRTFSYIKDQGLATEADYPYTGRNTNWAIGCRYNRKLRIAARTKGFVNIKQQDEAALADAVATAGVVAVGVQSRKSNLQFYKSGVHYSSKCDHKFIDHAMVVVGYGTTPEGEDYWLVKNSWGTSWGEDGYVRMARNRGDNCGIASYAYYPTL